MANRTDEDSNSVVPKLFAQDAVPLLARDLQPGDVIPDGIVKEVTVDRGTVLIEFTNGAFGHDMADGWVDVIARILEA